MINSFLIIKNYLNQNFETLIPQWFSNGYKANNRTYKTGDFNDTKPKHNGGSLVIDLIKKRAIDFATGKAAGDALAIYFLRFDINDYLEGLDRIITEYNLFHLVSEDPRYKDGKINKSIRTPYSYKPDISENNNLEQSAAFFSDNQPDNETIETNSNIDNIPKDHLENLPLTTSENKQSKKNNEYDNYKNKLITKILADLQPYKTGDPVDLYLKSRGITKHSNDTYIYNGYNGKTTMVNLCYNMVANKAEESEITGKLYKKTSIVAGIQQTFLTKDGNKIKDGGPVKKQLCFSDRNIRGNPVVLKAKGDNNGFIYVTEGIENGLSIQEYVNNEVWCTLSIVNIPDLPFKKIRYMYLYLIMILIKSLEKNKPKKKKKL